MDELTCHAINIVSLAEKYKLDLHHATRSFPIPLQHQSIPSSIRIVKTPSRVKIFYAKNTGVGGTQGEKKHHRGTLWKKLYVTGAQV